MKRAVAVVFDVCTYFCFDRVSINVFVNIYEVLIFFYEAPVVRSPKGLVDSLSFVSHLFTHFSHEIIHRFIQVRSWRVYCEMKMIVHKNKIEDSNIIGVTNKKEII